MWKQKVYYTPQQEAMDEIGIKIHGTCVILSRSEHADIMPEKLLEFAAAVREVDGLTIKKLGKHPTHVPFYCDRLWCLLKLVFA